MLIPHALEPCAPSSSYLLSRACHLTFPSPPYRLRSLCPTPPRARLLPPCKPPSPFRSLPSSHRCKVLHFVVIPLTLTYIVHFPFAAIATGSCGKFCSRLIHRQSACTVTAMGLYHSWSWKVSISLSVVGLLSLPGTSVLLSHSPYMCFHSFFSSLSPFLLSRPSTLPGTPLSAFRCSISLSLSYQVCSPRSVKRVFLITHDSISHRSVLTPVLPFA